MFGKFNKASSPQGLNRSGANNHLESINEVVDNSIEENSLGSGEEYSQSNASQNVS